MDYIFKTPSTLQRLVCMKIAAELWNQRDIRIGIEELGNQLLSHLIDYGELSEDFLKIWEKLTKRVFIKMSGFPLPESLKELFQSLIRPIGLEVLKWWYCHKKHNRDLVFPKVLCWTSHGTIDCRKTAEVLVKDEEWDVETRYIFACNYCLEDEVHALWKCIPEERQVEIEEVAMNRIDNINEIFLRSDIPSLVDFWTFIICGSAEAQPNNLLRTRNMHFSFVCELDNVAAVEYFLKKLSSEDKDVILVNILPFRNQFYRYSLEIKLLHLGVDVICFLLNVMSEEQLENVFEFYLYNVLICLLEWPWQGFIMKSVKRWWHFMSTHDYSKLLKKIMLKILNSSKDYNYAQLFLELWQLSPVNYKQDFIQLQHCIDLLALFEAKEEKLVRAVLKEATADQIERLLYSKANEYVIFVNREKWNYIEFLLKKCFISEKDINECKIKVKKCCSWYPADLIVKYDKFFKLADNFFLQKKRKNNNNIDKDDNSLVKKRPKSESINQA